MGGCHALSKVLISGHLILRQSHEGSAAATPYSHRNEEHEIGKIVSAENAEVCRPDFGATRQTPGKAMPASSFGWQRSEKSVLYPLGNKGIL